MLVESVKMVLGEELAQQVETALKGKGKDGKDLDLVIGNDGSYVPAEKYNGVNSGKTSAENALKAVAEALKAIGGSGDPTKIAADVETAKSTIKTLQIKHNEEIQKLQKTTALKMALADQVYDPDDIIPKIDLGKIEVDEFGNLKTDVTSLIEPIKSAKPHLFKQQNQELAPEIKGAQPALPGAPSGGKDPSQMTYSELCAYMAAHPNAQI